MSDKVEEIKHISGKNLKSEKERRDYLDAGKESGLGEKWVEHLKGIVRKSRKMHNHPVPDPEFFGY